jgi:hypothetical protein
MRLKKTLFIFVKMLGYSKKPVSLHHKIFFTPKLFSYAFLDSNPCVGFCCHVPAPSVGATGAEAGT